MHDARRTLWYGNSSLWLFAPGELKNDISEKFICATKVSTIENIAKLTKTGFYVVKALFHYEYDSFSGFSETLFSNIK